MDRPDSMDGNAKDLIDRLVQGRNRITCESSGLSWLAFPVAACRLPCCVVCVCFCVLVELCLVVLALLSNRQYTRVHEGC